MKQKQKKLSQSDAQSLAIKHQIYLQRVAETQAKEVQKLIDASEPELVAYLAKRLPQIGTVSATKKTAKEFADIEKKIAKIRQDAIDESEAILTSESVKLAGAESSFAAGTVAALAGAEAVKNLTEKVLSDIADYGIFSGRTIKDWFKSLANADTNRIMTTIRQSVISGLTTDEITKILVGSPTANYQDGILNATRGEARAIARTAANGVSNASRIEFYKANSDVVESLVFTATLDGRTSSICAALDGTVWNIPDDLDKVRQPPLHPNCRSTLVSLVKGMDGELIGKRPAANADFDALAQRAYDEEQKQKGSEKRWKDLASSTREKYVYQAQKTYEKETGKSAYTQVKAGTTYAEWFARQDEDFQRDILGTSRFELYKKGEFTLDKFVDYSSGRKFTLNELRDKDAGSFEKAGIESQKLESPKPGATSGGTIYVTEDGLNNFPSGNSFSELKPAYDAAKEGKESFVDFANGKKIEFGASYDENGKFYGVAKGHSTATEIPIIGKNMTFIHNHPDNMPFSGTDLRTFIEAQCKEMIVVVDGGQYTLTRSKNTDIITIEELNKRLKMNFPKSKTASVEVREKALKEVLHGSGITFRKK